MSSTNDIQPGTYVRIRGLVSAAQFNGKIGIAKSFNKGRYSVEILSPKKMLGVKPNNLELLCSANIPEPPEQPKSDDDDEDRYYEAVGEYMATAREAFDSGRANEEVQMYEWMIERGHDQPAAYVNLFFRYSGQDGSEYKDLDRACDCLQGAVDLLAGPNLEHPTSVEQLMDQQPSSSPKHLTNYEHFLGILIRLGIEFIADHRVIGRRDLQPEAKVLSELYQLARHLGVDAGEGNPQYQITHEIRSELMHQLGNVYRKIGDNNMAMECLNLSDLEANAQYQKETQQGQPEPPKDRFGDKLYPHNFEALLLLVDVANLEVSIASGAPITSISSGSQHFLDPSSQTTPATQTIQDVVEKARKVLLRMEECGYTKSYRGKIKLGQILCNQMMINQDTSVADEAYELLREGEEQARDVGDQAYSNQASTMLEKFR